MMPQAHPEAPQPADTQDQINDREWNDPANWHYGLIYSSGRDSRDWVPKRSLFGRRRYGGTPNFAKQSARRYMLLMVGLALVLFLAVVALERLGILR
jgi:uncharacterized membrane protein